MAQLIVTAKRLNIRKLIPTVLPDPSNIAGEIFLNDTFEADEVLEVPNKTLGKWYVDRHGYFYWGGGVKLRPTEDASFVREVTRIQTGFSWWLKNNMFSIPDIWTREPAQNVTIAILDTGINTHVDFDFTKITGFNYLDNTANYKTDAFGHGTHLAGIMVAKGIKSFGIIPTANLFIAKVSNDAGTPSFEAVKNALTDILNRTNGTQGVDVINMSFNLLPTNPAETIAMEEIRSLLKRLSVQTVLVSACGDEDWDFDNFPALMEECISVGSISENFARSSFSTKTTTLDIMAPGENIISSSGTGSTTVMEGTSQSAAIISAICAMAIKEFKNKGMRNIPLLKKTLFQTAVNNSFPLNEYGHGIFSPNSFIKAIKSI